jgi:ABC-2 type transport system permease protein
VSGEDSGLSWLSWASPIGWVQRVRPFADERWWVFALAAVAFVVLAAAAYALSSRRDVGAGFLPPRLGPATASPSLSSPLALAWRLHRGLLLGWTAAFVVMGAVFGSVTEAASDIVNDNPQLETLFERVGGQAGLADAYLSAIIGILGLAASGYALQATLRLRSEETAMRAEPLLATAVGRLRWATSHLLFAVVGPAVTLATASLAAGLTYGLSTGDMGEELPRVLARALVQLSAFWVLAGIAAALFGLLARLTFLSWAALGAFVLLNLFGEILQLDQWMLDFSPFTHIPDLPAVSIRRAPHLAGRRGRGAHHGPGLSGSDAVTSVDRRLLKIITETVLQPG